MRSAMASRLRLAVLGFGNIENYANEKPFFTRVDPNHCNKVDTFSTREEIVN